MPRRRNATKLQTVKITVHPVVKLYLQALVPKGVYGRTEAEIAGRIVEAELRRLIETKAITEIAWPPPP